MAFKSREYAFKDLSIVLGGRPITGFRELSYELERTVTKIYASGDKAHSRTKGNKEYKGQIELLQSEYEALQEAALNLGFEDVTDLDFDIVATCGKDLTSEIVTDILEDCCIPKLTKGWKQGDANMSVVLTLDIGNIKFRA